MGSRLDAPELCELRGAKDSRRGVLIRPASARLEAMSEACTAATRSLESAEESNYWRSNSDSPYTCCTGRYI